MPFYPIISNTLLIIFKVIAGILSGSVSILSEAIHSGMDLVASFVAFFSVKTSAKPADKKHPYGHGKIENISGLVEGVLIFIAAALIIKEAIKKIFEPAEIEEATYCHYGNVSFSTCQFFCIKKAIQSLSRGRFDGP